MRPSAHDLYRMSGRLRIGRLHEGQPRRGCIRRCRITRQPGPPLPPRSVRNVGRTAPAHFAATGAPRRQTRAHLVGGCGAHRQDVDRRVQQSAECAADFPARDERNGRRLHAIGVRFDRIGMFVADKEAALCTTPEFSADSMQRLCQPPPRHSPPRQAASAGLCAKRRPRASTPAARARLSHRNCTMTLSL